MEEGKLLQLRIYHNSGTHEGLVRKGGIYAGLAKAQEINQAGQVNEEEFGLSKIASLRK